MFTFTVTLSGTRRSNHVTAMLLPVPLDTLAGFRYLSVTRTQLELLIEVYDARLMDSDDDERMQFINGNYDRLRVYIHLDDRLTKSRIARIRNFYSSNQWWLRSRLGERVRRLVGTEQGSAP